MTPTGLRARLLTLTVLGSILVVGVLVAAFNIVLGARLRRDGDSLLRERAAVQLQTLRVVDGRLRVAEAPDRAAPDVQTWVFAGGSTLEQPVVDARSQRAAAALDHAPGRRLETVPGTDERVLGVPVLQGTQRVGTVVVGVSLRPYSSSAHTALISSIVLGGLTVLAIAVLSRLLIGRALAPVSAMTAAAAQWAADATRWGERDLSRRFFAGEPHDELTALAATFDRLLERLSQSLRRERRFTAEISHELRTPLAKIVAEAELAMGRERTPERYRRALESIGAAAQDLSRALEALLLSARVQPTGARAAVDACQVLERVAEAGRSAAGMRGVVIEVTGAIPGPRMAAEPELIERALAPLVDNAVRHASRRVDVAVRSVDGDVLFQVHDDGNGVDAHVRERIFEPGVSGGAGGGSGAGLGLPLARRLARAAGGEIDLQDAGDGGATFVLRLPSA